MARTNYLGAFTVLVTVTTAAVVALLVLVLSHPAGAAFPGENGEIAFQSDQDGDGPLKEDIYVMSADGTGTPTQLTNDQHEDLHPAFSADGMRLTFTSRRPAGLSDEIYVMNADGTDQTPLTGNPPRNFQSVYSPDGAKIAFVSFRDGPSEIYTMDSDGSNQTRLTNTTANETRPVFSPDGTKIAFTRRETTGTRNVDIYLMNPDGTEQTRLTTDPAQDNNANFSPDGTKIAFNRGGDIYLMNPDGTGQTRLTTTPNTEEFPAFSPDGKQLAFSSDLDGNFEIHVMASDGTGTPTQLTESEPPVRNSKPDWGPSDTTNPVLTLPGNITKEAEDGDGAAVTYTASAIDDRDGPITAICSPASGSVFPIGATTVNCSATDKAGNEATGSFTVIVKGAEEQLADLETSVRGLNIHHGIQKSLLSKLRGARQGLGANDNEDACDELEGFAHHARAQSGKKLTQGQASDLIEDADRIGNVLGC